MRTLELLAIRPDGATLTEISRELGAPKTSLVGILKGLQQLGYLVRSKHRYLLGVAATEFAGCVIPGRNLLQQARPLLRRLMRETGETALLGMLSSDANVAIYADKVESDNPVRYSVSITEQRELHCSAVGKCFLAFFDDDGIARYLKRHSLLAHTPKTITSRYKLREELARIRSAGVAHSEDERVIGASAVAAPIFGAEKKPIAAFVVGGPTERFRSRRRLYAKATVAAAEVFSRQFRLRRN